MKYVVLALKGMVYGVTNLLPGIGGGLILIILGIYEQFVDAVGNLFVEWRKWKEHLAFLVPMGIGAAVGMVAFAKLVKAGIALAPAPAMFLFMGLVVGTIPAVLRMHKDMRFSVRRGIAFLCGVVVVVLLKTAENNELTATWKADAASVGGFVYYLLSNVVAGGASVTPGLDGSYIWMLTGIYEEVMGAIGSVTELRHALSASSGGLGAALAGVQWAVLCATGIGAVGGIMIISKLIDMAIKRAPSLTYYVVLGLVVASIYGLWPRAEAFTAHGNLALTIVGAVVAFIVGAGLTLYLGRREAAQEA